MDDAELSFGSEAIRSMRTIIIGKTLHIRGTVCGMDIVFSRKMSI
jgi:hypothetical protein